MSFEAAVLNPTLYAGKVATIRFEPLTPTGWKRKNLNRSTHSLRFFFVRDLSTKGHYELRFSRRFDCADYCHRHFCHRHGRSFFAVTIALRQMTYWHDEILNTVELAPELLS
jgi:hypothetical protein